MMTRCIVHIGMHRTGSTSIQHSLRGFSDSRFSYAQLGDDPNHSLAMYSLFASEPERHPIHRRNGTDTVGVSDFIGRIRADLEQAVSAAKGRTLVISGEDIGSLPRDGLVKLRDDFEKRFEDVTLVGYIRPLAGLMTSVFQHRVRIGDTNGFDLERQYRPYKGTFGRFDEVFGQDRVNLWKFDVGSFPGRCAVQDFCARLGIDLPSERIVRLNESLPRQAVGLLYTYNKLGPHGAMLMNGLERQKLVDLLATIGNDPFRISVDVVKPILERNRADIAWMETRLGQALDEDLRDQLSGDVRGDTDLLSCDPIVTGKLLALLGDKAPIDVNGRTPQEIAQLVDALRHAGRERGKGPQSRRGQFGRLLALVQNLLR
jgi:hypothetical protein